MSEEINNSSQPPITHEDRARWELGTYVPKRLNEELTSMLRGLAWDKCDSADAAEINRLSVEVVGNKRDGVLRYNLHVSGFENLEPTFRHFGRKVEEVANSQQKPVHEIKNNLYGNLTKTDFEAPSLKPLVDVLVGFIQKESGIDGRYEIDFPGIMQEAADKVPQGVRVKKIWHDTPSGLPAEGQGQSAA